jgi:hypothetical protein
LPRSGYAKSVEEFSEQGGFMRAAFMSMTVADCFALCVLVALFVGAAAFWIAQGKFWTNDAKNAPERAETSANATFLADERKSDLSGATLATVNKGPASAPSLE